MKERIIKINLIWVFAIFVFILNIALVFGWNYQLIGDFEDNSDPIVLMIVFTFTILIIDLFGILSLMNFKFELIP